MFKYILMPINNYELCCYHFHELQAVCTWNPEVNNFDFGDFVVYHLL